MPVIRDSNNLNSYSESNNGSSNNFDKKISKKLDLLDQKMDGLYKDIYISRPDNKKNLYNVFDRLDDVIDQIQDDSVNVSGMTELLRRLDGKNSSNVNKLMNDVGDLFNDQNLINSLFMNTDIHRYISSQNYQYDMICRYLPKLQDALEIKRDNVLCSDNLSKDFVNPKSRKTNKEELEKFSNNTARLEKEYEITKFFEKTYMNVSKYGEDFIYIIPYNVAFERLLKRQNYRKNSARLGQISFYESGSAIAGSSTNDTIVCVSENYTESKEYKTFKESMQFKEDKTDNSKFKGFSVNLHFNDTNIINEVANDRVVLENIQELDKFRSLAAVFESNLSGDLSKQMEEINDQNDKLSSAASDGLIIPGNLDKDPNKIDKNMLGAVVERIPRQNIIPIYIGKICIGYYHFEFKEHEGACGFCGSQHHMTPGVSNAASYAYEMNEQQQDLAVKYIASRMSTAIDTRFINANKDIKEEIYMILKYNEKFDIARSNDVGVTFIPAEDIVHCYFDINEDTHRGISDLEKSVTPGMLYILLYLTDIIGKITRSTDKRIYYVKQNVETNVARTMMNVVQQIKKGNMGMRQIESMNNILNIVGKYNDFIIPMGQSGDPPIQFEIMNGQDIRTPTEIMEKMEEMAVNGTGVPFEMLNSTYQQDFAIRFSMSNTRFLKSVNTRQRDTERFFSKIYTKIYNYEFKENNSFISIILPPPIYLTIQNNQQLMDNISQQADKIVDLELVNEPDEVKQEFKKIFARNILASYMDFNQVERYKMMAKVNVEANKQVEVDSKLDDDVSSMDDDF